MNTVISGCLYELFGDDDEGDKESKWEGRYKNDKRMLSREYRSRKANIEHRIRLG